MYLGKTIRMDPHVYQGSGEYWVPHIKKHGYDVTTEILRECETTEELKEWGLYYSNLWNIVDERDENGNKTWANLKPEEGDGGATRWGDNHPMKNSEYREKLSGENHYSKKPGYEWKLSGNNHPSRQPGAKDRWAGTNHYSKKKDFEGVLFGGVKSALDPTVVAKRSGHNHYTKQENYVPKDPTSCYNYDHTIYIWENIHTREILNLTRQDFVRLHLNGSCNNISNLINNKKNVKSVKGWRLIRNEYQ